MNTPEAKARIKHVVRSLLEQNIPITYIRDLTDEAIMEVNKENYYQKRKF